MALTIYNQNFSVVRDTVPLDLREGLHTVRFTDTTAHLEPDSNRWVDESFEIRVRNHKKEAVEIRIVEHLHRWHNRDIRQPSNSFLRTVAQTIEFRIPFKPMRNAWSLTPSTTAGDSHVAPK